MPERKGSQTANSSRLGSPGAGLTKRTDDHSIHPSVPQFLKVLNVRPRMQTG